MIPISDISTSLGFTDGMSPIIQSIIKNTGMLVNSIASIGNTEVNAGALDAAKQSVISMAGEVSLLGREFVQAAAAQGRLQSWQGLGDSAEFISGSGIERFKKEISSADKMLAELLNSQRRINKQALNLDVLPREAVWDINFVNQRMETLISSMEQAKIRSRDIGKLDASGVDTLNNEYESMRTKISAALNLQESLNRSIRSGDISGLNNDYRTLNSLLAETEKQIRDNINAQEKFNQSVTQPQAGRPSSGGRLMNLYAGVELAQRAAHLISSTMGKVDRFTSTTARLDNFNDGLQTTAELQNKIFAASQRSRGNYIAMAGDVAKLNALAKDAFKTNDEAIRFSELLNKSFAVGGASTQEQQAGSYQLAQAMAAGRLQGDEFRSVMENAPLVAQAIAEYTGKATGELKEMSSQGLITAEIIKGAMFAAAGDIEGKFAQMPITFSQAMTSAANYSMMVLQPVLTMLQNAVNNQVFQSVMMGFLNLLYIASMGIEGLLGLIGLIGTTVYDNWSIIGPILTVLACTAIGGITAYLWASIPALTAHVAKVWAVAYGWLALNWPILLVAAAIGIVLVVLNKFGIGAEQIIGFVAGLFGALVTFIWNKTAFMWNIFLAFADFLRNVFINPVAAIQKLFYDLSINVLKFFNSIIQGIVDGINWVIDRINAVAGTDFSRVEGNFIAKTVTALEAKSAKLVAEKGLVDSSGLRAEMKDFKTEVGKFYEAGASFGAKLDNGFGNLMNGLGQYSSPDYSGMGGGGLGSGLGDVGNVGNVGNVGKIDTPVDISSEDLKYLRDIAERDAINKFTTNTVVPQLQVNIDKVEKDVDMDQIYGRITTMVEEELAVMSEGVHE